jgi:hypothetical protein
MSVRNGFVLLLALSALTFLVACGGSSSGIATPQAPPSGGFTNANLNGTYVFSVSGIDSSGDPYALAGTLTANGSGGNGKGGVTGGSFDLNDGANGIVVGASINSNSFYSISVDGRGQATLGNTVSGLGNLTFDFVLQDSTHGLITEFDTFGTGSGTIDLQASGVTPTGSYAFSLSGASGSSTWATAGNFTLTGSTISSGLDDLNEGGVLAYTGQSLTGSLVLASSNGPATTLTTAPVGGSTTFNGLFDAFAIDSTHLKLIEMDSTATLSGDAFSQPSTDFPTGALAFTMQGETTSSAPFALGGIMTATGSAVSGTEDYNLSPNVSSSPVSFTAVESAGGTGRFTLGGFATFAGGSSYAAYPSSGGLLLLEIDQAGVATGAAYSQSASATIAASQGYGLSLSGIYLGNSSANIPEAEVDDIAEFTTSSSGNTISGVIDENSTASVLDGFPTTFSAPFVNNSTTSSTYTAPSGGRGQIGAAVGTSSNDTTLNGGFLLTYYTVDGTTFPFIETDGGQVSSGVFVQQDSSASASAARHAMFVVQPLIRPHASTKKPRQTKFN